MTSLSIIGMLIGGGGIIVAFLIRWFGNSQRDAGKLEERDAQNREAVDAQKRADVVLNDGRTVDDTAEKLRRGEF